MTTPRPTAIHERIDRLITAVIYELQDIQTLNRDKGAYRKYLEDAQGELWSAYLDIRSISVDLNALDHQRADGRIHDPDDPHRDPQWR